MLLIPVFDGELLAISGNIGLVLFSAYGGSYYYIFTFLIFQLVLATISLILVHVENSAWAIPKYGAVSRFANKRVLVRCVYVVQSRK